MAIFAAVRPTARERAASLPGDELLAAVDVVMDRGFTLPGTAEAVWPWFVQLGKQRAGWYLPRRLERAVAPGRRGLRHIDPRWQSLAVGDVIPDWGGRDESFEVARLEAPGVLVHRSRRGAIELTWAITLAPGPTPSSTRVHLRLRLAGVRRRWLAVSAGELIDLLSVAGLAAGLRERV